MKKIINKYIKLCFIMPFWIFLILGILGARAQTITAYEYWLNNDIASKTVVPVSAVKVLTLNESIQLQGVKQGFQIFNIRFKDNKNIYSSVISQPIYGLVNNSPITAYQYWFDFDVSQAVTKTTGTSTDVYTLNTALDVSKLKNGSHILNIRFKEKGGNWSQTMSSFFQKFNTTASPVNLVTGYRYWYDKDVSHAVSVHFKTPADFAKFSREIAILNIPKGAKYLNLQVKDTIGLWSSPIPLRFGPFSRFSAMNLKGVNAFTVNFTNKSTFSESFSWDFGDNSTSNQANPSHTFKEPGAYKVILTARNSLGFDTVSAYVFIRGLAKVVPESSGNTGDATLSAFGGIFKPGTTLILRKAGQSDIIGDSLILSKPGTIISTFDLRSKPTGKYDIVVNIPGDTIMTLEEGFAIEEGKPADPWVEITGRDRILFNTWQTYTINYGNNGNIDASGVPVWIAIPDEPASSIRFDDINIVHSKYVIDKGLTKSYDTVPLFFKTNKLFGQDFKARVYPLFIPIIPANSKLSAHISIKTGSNTSIIAWTNSPYFQSPFNGELAACLVSVMGEGLVDIATGAIPGVGCLQSIGKQVYNPWDNYRPESSNTWGSWMWNTMVTAVDCGINLSGAGAVVKSIGVFAANMGTYAKAIKDCKEAFNDKSRSNRSVRAVSSFDPNEIIGPVGYSADNYTKKSPSFPYTIYFENKASATAPAHEVIVYDTLDKTKFDVKNFSFGPVSFGDTTVFPPEGQSEFTMDVNLKPKIDLVVRINATLDTMKGVIKWDLLSLNPLTMNLTDSIELGFLPPNKISPQGEGSVSYTIGLKSTLDNNTKIKNKAAIYFDANAPIFTNEYLNTIDIGKPVSAVIPLEKNEFSEFTLSWSGTDAGAGIRDYSIYVLVNDTGLMAWKANTIETSAVFKGTVGYNYKFYSVATDNVGNMEDNPVIFDTETTLILGIHNNQELQEDCINISPNPFSKFTTIEYCLSKQSDVSITIYSFVGAKIHTILNSKKPSGKYSLALSSENLKQGVYFIEFKTRNCSIIRKIVIN